VSDILFSLFFLFFIFYYKQAKCQVSINPKIDGIFPGCIRYRTRISQSETGSCWKTGGLSACWLRNHERNAYTKQRKSDRPPRDERDGRKGAHVRISAHGAQCADIINCNMHIPASPACGDANPASRRAIIALPDSFCSHPTTLEPRMPRYRETDAIAFRETVICADLDASRDYTRVGVKLSHMPGDASTRAIFPRFNQDTIDDRMNLDWDFV